MNLQTAKDIFGLTYKISEDELKVIYRKLAISKHPDTNKSPRAKEEFQELQVAYKLLLSALPMLPGKPKPKPNGDTIWRMFNGNTRQKVTVPFDALIENDLVLYFTWHDKEWRVAVKKGVDLPYSIKIDGIDLMIEFVREKGPVARSPSHNVR